ncbi:MAG: helix-turn-helix transcriptional regulator [Paludibacter sp.]|nr:helix-turn-helix transcriptional regulator [Bacteroidales bacterium]MCM1069354.1 helix-turn-helix transcriptional regulator [Prevotella sp.]MCM1353874.1 helix-turn-helix transcriptional regulator [Bacteroides sp.]MCM1442876.1 helix-turn-helix transcriptional regulator [Muribaculum sp.]MCM1481921.1 helix-turn-helix transcriptional regulator [Paludibacter sp.]
MVFKVFLVEKGQTQTWLAEKIGKCFNTVNAYCSNRQQPTLNVLQDIAHVLEVDIRDLLTPKENLYKNDASR